jgi:hypothetical protein
MQTWKDKHPSYTFMSWDNETVPTLDGGIERLIAQMWGAGRWHGVSDLVRYEVLYRYGGFVAPADSECLQPIDDLLELEAFACYESEDWRPGLISPHLGAAPGDALIGAILDRLRGMDTVLHDDPWKVTGNALLTQMVAELGYSRIKILPSYSFIPEHYEGSRYTGPGKVYARHFWSTTKGIADRLDQVLGAA